MFACLTGIAPCLFSCADFPKSATAWTKPNVATPLLVLMAMEEAAPAKSMTAASAWMTNVVSTDGTLPAR